MTSLSLIIRTHLGPRRGLIALSLAFSFMLIVFTVLVGFTLGLVAQSLRVENAWAATQALYAAEAGLDVALQVEASNVVGRCGRGRYAVVIKGRQVTALGEVERAAGAPIRSAVTVRRTVGGGIVRGSWRLVPPARQTELIALLERAEEREHR